MGYGGTERWEREELRGRRPWHDWDGRYPSQRRPGDLAVALVCVLLIGLLGLCAWLGMALAAPKAEEEAELPTHRVTHDSMCVTYTYDGEMIRWYVMIDPDYQIQHLVNDRGGCCVRLDSNGNVMGVSGDAGGGSYEWE